MPTMRRAALASLVGVSLMCGAPGVAGAGTQHLTIADPGSPPAGAVTLRGSVSADAETDVTSVVYVIDVSDSTRAPSGRDCDGDGDVGAPGDNVNGDGTAGDVLDCEIQAVLALDHSLAGAPRVAASLEVFGSEAAMVDLDPAPGVTTVAEPGYTGGDPQPRLETAARSIRRGFVGQYTPSSVGGNTDFDQATRQALDGLADAPPGPKYIMFMSDGGEETATNVFPSASTLAALRSSGVRLRGFAAGLAEGCAAGSALEQLSAATHETCTVASSPTALTARLVGSAPDAVNRVEVTLGGTTVVADVDAVGGWRAGFLVGAGTYTGRVTVTFRSGVILTATRTFTVVPAAGGPAPGTVAPGPGFTAAVPPPVAKHVHIVGLHYNPAGRDTRANLNQEFVKITNAGSKEVILTRWTLRDGDGHVYRFPTTKLRAHAAVLVHTGSGSDRPGHRYWGRANHVWDNDASERARIRDSYGRVIDTCAWKASARGATTC